MSKPDRHKQSGSPERRRRGIKIALWGIFSVLFLISIAALWLWTERYRLVENQIQQRISELGFEAEFKLEDFDLKTAELRDIRVSQNGLAILKADKLNVTYNGREVLKGVVTGVQIDGLKGEFTLDKDGRPNLILPQTSGGGEPIVFPKNGVFVSNSKIKVTSPYGEVRAAADGSMTDWDVYGFSLTDIHALFSYGDISARLTGEIEISRSGENPADFSADFDVQKWRYRDIEGEDLRLQGYGRTIDNLYGRAISADLEAAFDGIQGKAVQTDSGRVFWSGDITIPKESGRDLVANGNWEVSLNGLQVPEAARRDKLAGQVVLRETLSSTPVTQHFAEPLSDQLASLLSQSTLEANGRLDKNEEKTEIYISDDLLWRNAEHRLIFRADGQVPIYQYIENAENFHLSGHLDLLGRLPIILENARIEFLTSSGRNIKGVGGFTARVRIPKNWSSINEAGQTIALRPTQARIVYVNNETYRSLRMTGAIDYDGDIPGGYITGLEADGQLDVVMNDETLLYFKPAKHAQINIEKFETQTPWVAQNIQFTLDPNYKTPLFTIDGENGTLEAKLKTVAFDLNSLDGMRSLNMTAENSIVLAQITDKLQSWDVTAETVFMQSDNMPSEGTEMRAPQMTMSTVLRTGLSPEFKILAPVADVKTSMIDARGLEVQSIGTAEAFRTNYKNGSIKFLSTDMPPFKMTGFVDYSDNIWMGEADSVLPFGQKTPIDITYKFDDGQGSAKVVVPEMIFSPRTLQPQNFIPALRGKIADVRGRATAQIDMTFSDIGGLQSSGTAKLMNMSMGTLPGPISGLNADLKFSSFFPLVTDGTQTVEIESFDPGFPLPEGVVEFEAIPNGVKIHSAIWPVGDGQISLDPTTWTYLASENRMLLRVANVSLGHFMGDIGGKNFQITGDVTGEFPVIMSGVNVKIENGRMAVEKGGVVRFTTPFTDLASETNDYARLAFDTLKEFYYEELEVTINGPLDGLINVRLLFDGFNPNVMDGAYIRYNINIEGELLNIARNFQNLGKNITTEIKRAVLEDKD